MIATVPICHWITPSGSLAIDETGGVSALIRTTLRTDEVVAASVQALSNLVHAPFLGRAQLGRSELGYTLKWPAPSGGRKSLMALAPDWRRDPSLHVATAIAAALAISRAMGELQHLAPRAFLLSPAQLFLESDPDERQHWTVLPLPIDAASFKDMSVASACLTAWLTGDDLVRRGSGDRTYAIAAVLHYALIGELYPSNLSPMKRLQRQLAYRAGNAAQHRKVLEQAIPAGLALSARRLGDFISEALRPDFGRPITVIQAAATLQRLEVELSAPFLAGGWETEGWPERALAILEAYARLAPSEAVPWQTLARLRRGAERQDDCEAGQTPPPEPGHGNAESPVTLVGKIKAAAAMGRDRLSSVLNDVLRPGALPLAEDERLFAAYAAGRWLAANAVALPLLAQPCAASWNNAVRALLLARLHSDQKSWAQVASDCRDCTTLINGLPGRGEKRGAYASAFALILDAGAHIGFVSAGHAPDYLEDAWKKLERARTLCDTVTMMSLEGVLSLQLHALREQLIQIPRLSQLLTEVNAVRTTFSLAAANDGAPQILPWPEDRWLFT